MLCCAVLYCAVLHIHVLTSSRVCPCPSFHAQVSWAKPLVPVDLSPDFELTLPQLNAFLNRFDQASTAVGLALTATAAASKRATAGTTTSRRGGGGGGHGAASIAYQPLMSSLALTRSQMDSVSRVRAACAEADDAALHAGVGAADSGWLLAMQRLGQSRTGTSHGKATPDDLRQCLASHGVRVVCWSVVGCGSVWCLVYGVFGVWGVECVFAGGVLCFAVRCGRRWWVEMVMVTLVVGVARHYGGEWHCGGPLCHQVVLDVETIDEVVACLEVDDTPSKRRRGGDADEDEDERQGPMVRVLDFLQLCRPIDRHAALAEGKLRRHIRSLRSEGIEPMAAFGAFDRHNLGFVSRSDMKKALRVRIGDGKCVAAASGLHMMYPF